MIGQEYTFLAVPEKLILSTQYSMGRILSFTFSPHTVLLISIIGLSSFFLLSRKIRKFNYTFLFLMLLVFLIVISASKSYFFPNFSVIYSIQLLGFICFSILSITKNNLLNNKQRDTLWRSLFFQILITLLFISLISIFQLVNKSTLGLNIEAIKIAPVFGVGADESNLIFRPIGLTPHANMMANQVFLLMLTLIVVFVKIQNKRKFSKYLQYLFVGVSLISIFTITISQSRSVYLGLFVFFLLMFFFNYSQLKRIISVIKLFVSYQPKIWLLSFMFISLVVMNRALYSIYSFTETGGGQVRKELAEESLFLIKKYPLLGVGKGMFVPALAAENPTGVVSKFPESVHNGFLLFIVESGLLSQLVLFVVIYFLFRKIYLSTLKSNLKSIIIIGLVSQLIPMFFQPFINYLSVYTIFTLVIIFENENVVLC